MVVFAPSLTVFDFVRFAFFPTFVGLLLFTFLAFLLFPFLLLPFLVFLFVGTVCVDPSQVGNVTLAIKCCWNRTHTFATMPFPKNGELCVVMVASTQWPLERAAELFAGITMLSWSAVVPHCVHEGA